MLRALYEVVSKTGSHMNEVSRNSILGLIDSDTAGLEGMTIRRLFSMSNSNKLLAESMAITNARLVGALIKSMPPNTGAGSLIK